jgi:hypothetical protein
VLAFSFQRLTATIPPDATRAAKGGKETLEPPIDLLGGEPEPTPSKFITFAYYNEVIPVKVEGAIRNAYTQ